MQYSQRRLNAVRKRSEAAAAKRPPKTEMKGGDGVLQYSIPKEAYFNAVTHHGVDPNDTGYWSDMARRYPEIVVPYTPRNAVFGAGPRTIQHANRFGRPTSRTLYRTLPDGTVQTIALLTR